MRTLRLPCFCLFWVALCVLYFSPPAASQISPGPLAQSHSTLEGATNCTVCHKIAAGKPTFACLDCHTEIATRITAKRGLHASYNIQPGVSQGCRRCHSDHNGRDFRMIKLDIQNFDHKTTGYVLEGKHVGLACNKCHTADHIAREESATIKVKDLNRTFLGTSQKCITCHVDQHKGRLGTNCLQCHNYNDWKTINIGKFDHSKTRYPLTGLHAKVACDKCHTPGPDNRPRYAGIPFQECTDCHRDPHRGAFPQDCRSCHTTTSWKDVPLLDKHFDHSKTKYPLLGKHATVECAKCHAGGDFKKKLAFQKCMDCHADFHRGQFVKRSAGACEGCHTVNTFRPSTFGLKEHASTTQYPLTGGHARLKCVQCHVPKGGDTIFKMPFQHCTDCHADKHVGQFARDPYRNDCERCHTVKAYIPCTFTRARHEKTRFPITGAHVAVPCTDCHRLAQFKGTKSAQYHWTSIECVTCHADPHRGQFDIRMQKAVAGGKPGGCAICHSAKSWKAVTGFDHSTTSFPLIGAHLTIACGSCHKPTFPKDPRSVDFKAAPEKCEQCHENVHAGQFAKKNGITACADCHNSAKWKPSIFDHDRRTSFPLNGAHLKAPCSGCHKLTRVVGAKQVLFYAPTPKECAACHGQQPKAVN